MNYQLSNFLHNYAFHLGTLQRMNENLPNKHLLDSAQDLNFSDGHSKLSSTTDKEY